MIVIAPNYVCENALAVSIERIQEEDGSCVFLVDVRTTDGDLSIGRVPQGTVLPTTWREDGHLVMDLRLLAGYESAF